MKAVLISIKPKWCDLIRRGRKTVEVRKTCPKLEAAMPAAQKKARRQIDVLTRAKERLMELMEEPQK